MHTKHLIGCVIAIGLAVVLFAATEGSIGGLGLLLAVLICPITMGTAMWFLMGSQRQGRASGSDEVKSDAQVLDTTIAVRR